MSSYSSYSVAKELPGGHMRKVLLIEQNDADTQKPTNLTLLGSGTDILAFGSVDDGFWPFDSSASPRAVIEPRVKSWGTVDHAGYIGTAYETTADMRVVLSNEKTSGQLDNSDYTYAVGGPAMNPEPTGDEVRMAELMQYFTWENNPVSVKLYWFPNATTDDTTTQKTYTVFTGVVSSVRVTHDEIVLDLIQKTQIEESTLPGREITDPPENIGKGIRAPICYGSMTYETGEFIGGSTDGAIPAGFHPALIPAIPFDTDSSGHKRYIYCDIYGRNSGYQSQIEWPSTNKSSVNDKIIIVDPDTDVSAGMVEGTSVGQMYFVDDTTGSNTNEYLSIYRNGVPTGVAYVPADAVHAESATGVTNSENAVSRDPATFARIEFGAANWVEYRIPIVPPLGEVIQQDDCVTAYIIHKSGTYTGSPRIFFGIWRDNSPDNWYDFGSGAVYGIISGTDFNSSVLRTQKNENSVNIAKAEYDVGGTAKSPLIDWEWRYPDSGGDFGNLQLIVVRIEVDGSNLGTAGEYFDVVGCGIVLDFYVGRPKTGATATRGGRVTGSRGRTAG